MAIRVLVFAGSLRNGSFNEKLARAMSTELGRLDAEVTHLSLGDYPLPLFDQDRQKAEGVPASGVRLAEIFMAHQGIFIASPEYNAGVTPLLKNVVDWVSRVSVEGQPPLPAFRNRVFALGAASGGNLGGYRSLIQLRQILELGTGALVLPGMVSVPGANAAFDEAGFLKEERAAKFLTAAAEALIEVAGRFA